MPFSPKIVTVGSAGDTPNGAAGSSAPGANGTWTNFIAGTTSTDTAVAAAGYVECPAVSDAGAAITVRFPCFLNT